jgi:hypothetical protein
MAGKYSQKKKVEIGHRSRVTVMTWLLTNMKYRAVGNSTIPNTTYAA